MNLEDTFESKIHKVLVDNILSFWQKSGIDSRSRLPHGKIDGEGIPIAGEPIGAILTARILYAFSAAYNALKIDQYLKTVEMMYQGLVDCFLDPSHGGLWYAVSRDKSVSDQRKCTDCQAYGIYAFCEYFNVTEDKTALAIASDLFNWIEKNALSGQNDSYVDLPKSLAGSKKTAGKKDLDAFTSARSLNTHLHLLESYTSLYNCTKDAQIQDRLKNLFRIIVDYFYGDGLFYAHLAHDLRPQNNVTLYGMNLETAWLLNLASRRLNDESYAQKADEILLACASKTLAIAVDKDGAVYYSGDGCKPLDHTKQWWVQAEAAVAFLVAYEKSRKTHYFDAFLLAWDYMLQHLVDWKVGEWRLGLTRSNKVMADDHRAGFWKCPYHNTRVCLETLKRKALIGEGLELCTQTDSLEFCLEPSLHS